MKTIDATTDGLPPDPLRPDLKVLLSETFLQASQQHRELILEYCMLALKPFLSEAEQDRYGEILTQAMEDKGLDFWLEEADHLVAHHLDLIDAAFVKDQQDKLRQAIRYKRFESFWEDLQAQIKVLQTHLKNLGVYNGSIDGMMCPCTQEAINKLQKQQSNDMTWNNLF